MGIRQLSLAEFETLYKERIAADFPRGERRPLFAIRGLYRKGQYVCIVLDEGGILAYAAFIYHNATGSVLLDYFAVAKDLRGSGIGSRFLAMLQEYWDKDGIILECEAPESATNAEETSIRNRRIAFYERGGAVVTTYRWQAFGVAYRILWLPINRQAAEVDIVKELPFLYQCSMPGFLCRLLMKLEPAEE